MKEAIVCLLMGGAIGIMLAGGLDRQLVIEAQHSTVVVFGDVDSESMVRN